MPDATAKAVAVVTTRTAFDKQAEIAYRIAIDAQRLRSKKLVFVFESRAAVLCGIERALREMQAVTWRHEDGRKKQKVRIAVYMESDVLKWALAGSSNRWNAHSSAGIEMDVFFQRLYDDLAALGSSTSDDFLRRVGVLTEEVSVRTRSLRVRRVLEGYRLDESLWRYDFGILDADYGCPDQQRRAIHKVRIRAGLFDVNGVCKPCSLFKDCSYMKGTLKASGVIVGHHTNMTFERVVSVLLGPVPPAPHRAERSRLSVFKGLARTKLNYGAGGRLALRRLLKGQQIDHRLLRTLHISVIALHDLAARHEAELRTKYDELKAQHVSGQPWIAAYRQIGKALREAAELRKDLCGLRLLLDLGGTPELIRLGGAFIQRPVVMLVSVRPKDAAS